jgi:hypothetical protein
MRQIGKSNGFNGKKKVVQFSKEGGFIKEWESITDACLNINGTTTNISQVCRGNRDTAYGYKWMYKEDYDQYIEQIQINS